MRIVSWNMNACKRTPDARAKAWDYLRKELRADVALVQEAVPPTDVGVDDKVYAPLSAVNPRYNWGSAVVALAPDIRLRSRPRLPLASWDADERPRQALPDSHPGASAVADVTDLKGQPLFTAVSLYGQWEMTAADRNYHACAKVHRILSDLTDVLAQSRRNPVILAGDLNLTSQLEHDGQNRAPALRARAAFDRIRAWNLTDCVSHTRLKRPKLPQCACLEGADCSHVQTYRHGNKADSRPTQLDYAFMSDGLVPRLVGCQVVHDEQAWALSDHCPIVVEITI